MIIYFCDLRPYFMTANPLLKPTGLPLFSQIKPQDIEPALDFILASHRKKTAELLTETAKPDWFNMLEPLEQLDNELSLMWSPVSHLNSVMNSDELTAAYNACLPKLSHYSTEMGQNKALFEAYKAIAENTPELNQGQKKLLDNALRDFHLSGIDLPKKAQQRYKEISEQLSQLTNDFSQNVLKSTHDWHQLITDQNNLAGLPESALSQAKQSAEQRDMQGWLLTLDFPSYHAIMTYAESRELREEMYIAFSTRASDQAPSDPQWDNSQNMRDILQLRQEKAQLLGFKDYATYSLHTKMATDTEEVLQFLTELAEKALPQARQELAELQEYAQSLGVTSPLEAWDISFYSEKLRQHRFQLNQEQLRPWFPIDKVVEGLFAIVKKLYGIHIVAKKGVDTWHPDVRFYDIFDEQQQLCGQFYLDLFARQHKRGGAWMDECQVRIQQTALKQHPVAYLTCNFTPPLGDKPALLTHSEVETLFHEFGHGLHHLLTKIDYAAISGINGVAWDAVELPSQFMENWAWEAEALALFSGHFETGEPLPQNLLDKMIQAKNFQSAMMTLRQIEFALFDMLIHQDSEPAKEGKIYQILAQVRKTTALYPVPKINRFAHAFSHIFAGGYAAGYYSYKWAEVLSADAFSLFEEKGIFEQTTGRAFLHHILEKGGSQDAMDLFIAFRGRKPKIDALLRHNGII